MRQNVGLKETLNPTKRVSIGNIGTGAFDGSAPSINIGDSDSGFIGSADGVIDIYADNQRVGRFGPRTFELFRTLILKDTANAVGADTNFSTLLNAYDATGYIRWAWGPHENGWDIHSYDQKGVWRSNPLHIDYQTSEIFTPYRLHVAGAVMATDGNIYGTRWNAGGAWLWDTIAEQLTARDNNINIRSTWDWVNQNFVNDIFLGVEQYYSPGSNTISWNFHTPNGHVLTGINVQDTGAHSADNIGGVYYKPIQKKINGALMTIAG
ncbi:hypothetical protein OD507_000091 [Salmonella enterica]|nr:hypothetical protein [Salmonella enterica]EJX4243726.1 hypothetical protein [Salmonella enterica]